MSNFAANALARRAVIGALLLALPGAAQGQSPSNASHEAYLDLQRKAEAFVGQPLSFAGKVIQAVQSGQSYALRINVTPGNYNSWQDTIYVDYSAIASSIKNGVAEGSLVSVRGTFTGIKSYQSVIGDTIQVPSVVACMIQPGLGNIPACPGERK
jgi:hypothetical protein